MRRPTLYWAALEWGSETPACRQAIMVSPEQSKQPGPDPPQQ
jgi:hypothetical protein